MSKEPKSNRQMLNAFLKDCDDFELALLRERIIWALELTKEAIKNEPEKWKNGIVHPEWYNRIEEKAQKHMGFPSTIKT
jgi:hypothetical protein